MKIAVFAGPTATILNSHPLVTSRKARSKYGLDQAATEHEDRATRPYDALRPQRLAAPATVYVEQFSAHPLERDAAGLYGPPDGYVDGEGRFSPVQRSPQDVPVYEVVLDPSDGLYPLPYMARRSDGGAWEHDAVDPERPDRGSRQPFFPDASRLFEEIDRLVVGPDGDVNALSRLAEFEFHRAAPPAGYRHGLPEAERTDVGAGDVHPERLGVDFFPYRPASMRREPLRRTLATVTNRVQQALDDGAYDGLLWLEGSPFVEETSYWLNLVLDTEVPVAACAGQIGPEGAATVVDAVRYLTSRIWTDPEGRDRIGAVCVQDERVFTSREVQKTDDRPGGYVATGGHGGVVASMGKPGPPVLTFLPVRRSTWRSEVRLSVLPRTTTGLALGSDGSIVPVPVDVKDDDGRLLGDSIPAVHVLKHSRYHQDDTSHDDRVELELRARIRRDLGSCPLVGFVIEGSTPYGDITAPLEAGLREAALSGVPFVKVGRGDVGGFVPSERVPFGIAGGNLTATKARLLLMACLLRHGALPPARDPADPTDAEVEAVHRKFADYQAVFDSH